MFWRCTFVLLAMIAVWPAVSVGQARTCSFEALDPTRETFSDPLTGLIVSRGPFVVRCNDGVVVSADSGTVNQAAREVHLVGHVDFADTARTLTAQEATYSAAIGRLYATGDVVFSDRREGVTIRGPELEYFRAMEGRPEPQVNAGSRPHLTLRPRDADPDDPPLEVDADRVTILGEDDLSAYGSVVIEQADLRATAEEAKYQGDVESLELNRKAVIHSEEHTLRGEVIQAQMEESKLKEVRARTGAALEAEDLSVTAPDIQLFLREDRVERTIARTVADSAGARPVALSRTFRLEADSIDAVAPAQRLERVTAIGRARGEAIDTTGTDSARVLPAGADSTRLRGASAATSLDQDWIEGDTIIGYFRTTESTSPGAEADTSVELQRLVARGNARSLYHLEAQPEGDDPTPPTSRSGVNFASAETITLDFEEGEVTTVELVNVRRAIYLEPAPPPAEGGGTPANTVSASPAPGTE